MDRGVEDSSMSRTPVKLTHIWFKCGDRHIVHRDVLVWGLKCITCMLWFFLILVGRKWAMQKKGDLANLFSPIVGQQMPFKESMRADSSTIYRLDNNRNPVTAHIKPITSALCGADGE